jgi:hypothetical protein
LGRPIDRISAILFLLNLMNVGIKNEQGLTAANELVFEVLRLVLKYPHKANVVTTNEESLPNAHKGNSQPGSVCLDLGTTQMERTCQCVQTVTRNILA